MIRSLRSSAPLDKCSVESRSAHIELQLLLQSTDKEVRIMMQMRQDSLVLPDITRDVVGNVLIPPIPR